jgi:hypothetical protein
MGGSMPLAHSRKSIVPPFSFHVLPLEEDPGATPPRRQWRELNNAEELLPNTSPSTLRVSTSYSNPNTYLLKFSKRRRRAFSSSELKLSLLSLSSFEREPRIRSGLSSPSHSLRLSQNKRKGC